VDQQVVGGESSLLDRHRIAVASMLDGSRLAVVGGLLDGAQRVVRCRTGRAHLYPGSVPVEDTHHLTVTSPLDIRREYVHSCILCLFGCASLRGWPEWPEWQIQSRIDQLAGAWHSPQ